MKLETAKELKRVADEFGVELPKVRHLFKGNNLRCSFCGKSSQDGNYCNKRIKQFSTDELLEWLGKYSFGNGGVQLYGYNKDGGSTLDKLYSAILTSIDSNKCKGIASTPSEALVLLAIELIKNKIIK